MIEKGDRDRDQEEGHGDGDQEEGHGDGDCEEDRDGHRDSGETHSHLPAALPLVCTSLFVEPVPALWSCKPLQHWNEQKTATGDAEVPVAIASRPKVTVTTAVPVVPTVPVAVASRPVAVASRPGAVTSRPVAVARPKVASPLLCALLCASLCDLPLSFCRPRIILGPQLTALRLCVCRRRRWSWQRRRRRSTARRAARRWRQRWWPPRQRRPPSPRQPSRRRPQSSCWTLACCHRAE